MISKGQKTRNTIINAADNLFYQLGYDITSYQEVAQASHLKKANIQYHFSSKTDLLTAVIEHRIEQIRALLEKWSFECDTPYNCLNQFVSMIENNADDLARYGCPMGTLSDELGKSALESQAEARQMFDLFLRWLEARFRAIFPPKQAKDYAQQLMAMAQGASVLSHIYNDPEIIKNHAKMMRKWLKTICKI